MTIVGIRILVLGRVKWIVRDSSNGGFVDFLAISRCSDRRALHELDECIIFSSYFLSSLFFNPLRIMCESVVQQMWFLYVSHYSYLLPIIYLNYYLLWTNEAVRNVSADRIREMYIQWLLGLRVRSESCEHVSIRWEEKIFTQTYVTLVGCKSRNTKLKECVDLASQKQEVDRMKS